MKIGRNVIFWPQHNWDNHELTSAVGYSTPTQDDKSSVMNGEEHYGALPFPNELLTTDAFREKRITIFKCVPNGEPTGLHWIITHALATLVNPVITNQNKDTNLRKRV